MKMVQVKSVEAAAAVSLTDAIAEAVEMVHITGRRLDRAVGADRVAAQVVHDEWQAELQRLDRHERIQRAISLDPHAWLQDWRDAGGSFARVEGRLVVGVFVGQGEDAPKLSSLILVLDRTAGAREAVATLLEREREAA
jgi:hypothetical protein